MITADVAYICMKTENIEFMLVFNIYAQPRHKEKRRSPASDTKKTSFTLDLLQKEKYKHSYSPCVYSGNVDFTLVLV